MTSFTPRRMAKFDAREEGYVRVEVPRNDIEAASWQRLAETGKIWVYIAVNSKPGVGLPAADAQFPMVESHIDVVVERAAWNMARTLRAS
jgi:hypothetical protein